MFLLCALPGTPVLLYGDEIGMGDEIELPDRAAVRTPMQWSSGMNAGFSSCSPVELVHPVVDGGAFRYQDVNVELQLEQPASLLRTLQELFMLRRRHGPFLPEHATPVRLDVPEVLAICYDGDDGETLFLANLSARGTDVVLPAVLAAEWHEVAHDEAYCVDVHGDELHLHGFGYRWLHRRARERA